MSKHWLSRARGEVWGQSEALAIEELTRRRHMCRTALKHKRVANEDHDNAVESLGTCRVVIDVLYLLVNLFIEY